VSDCVKPQLRALSPCAGVFSIGEPGRAIAIAKMQMRLDPFHPHFAPLMAGVAHYHLREYHDAQHWLSEAIGRAPNHQYGHAFLAATYAQLGRMEDARAEAAEVLRLNPRYSISGTQKRYPFSSAQKTWSTWSTDCERPVFSHKLGERGTQRQKSAILRPVVTRPEPAQGLMADT
jgi:tetratricopeptide (TPR) repeat protein